MWVRLKIQPFNFLFDRKMVSSSIEIPLQTKKSLAKLSSKDGVRARNSSETIWVRISDPREAGWLVLGVLYSLPKFLFFHL